MLLRKKNLLLLCLLSILFCLSVNGQTHVSGDQTGIWTKAKSPYILDGSVTVPSGQKLTIQPGVEVQSMYFGNAISVQGTLSAVGAATDSIRFRGLASPTNNTSTKGGYIYFDSGSSSSLQYVAIDNWGQETYTTAAVMIYSSSFTISNSSIRNCGNAVYIAGGVSNKVIITNSTISNTSNTGIHLEPASVPVISNVVFSKNGKAIEAYPSSVTGITGCSNVAINLISESISQNSVIPKPGTGSYYMLQGGFTIPAGLTMTVKPGVEIRSQYFGDAISVQGTLNAVGTTTDSIRFRGLTSPTNTTSTRGGYIYFDSGSSGSSLQYVAIDNWGQESYTSAAVMIYSSSFTISNSSIRNCSNAVYIAGSVSNKVIITNSTISNSSNTGIHLEPASVPVISNIVFSKNGKAIEAYASSVTGITGCNNIAINLISESISQNSVIPKPGTGSYYMLQGGFTIPSGITMTIKPGVEIRSQNYGDAISVQGTLSAVGTATDSIRFRGFANPNYSYSTKGGYLYFNSESTGSALQYVAVDNWGDPNYSSGIGAVTIYASAMTLSNSSIRNSGNNGIYIGGGVTNKVVINNNTISGNNTGIHLESAAVPVISNIVFSKNTKGIEAYPSSVTGIAGCANVDINLISESISQNSVIPKPGTGSYYMLQGGFTIPSGITMTIKPGVEIRSQNYGDAISVQGILNAVGTATDSIRFRGFANPTYSYSTKGGYIYFDAGGGASSLQYIAIDNWGDPNYSSGIGAVTIYAPAITLSNSSIRNSGNSGIYIGGGLTNKVVINNNTISGNNTGIHLESASVPVISNIVFSKNTKGIEAYTSSVTGIAGCTNVDINLINETIAQNSVIPKPGTGSYYVLQGGFTIPTGIKLSIQSGVEIRSQSYTDAINVQGTLIAVGTATDSIKFRGFASPIYSYSKKGGYIYFDQGSTGSSLQFVSIDNWGDANATGLGYAINVYTGSLNIRNSCIRNAQGIGININASVSPVIASNTFSGSPKAIQAYPSGVVGISDCANAAVYLVSETIGKTSVLPQPGPGAYYVLQGGFTIPANLKLTIQPGVEIRSSYYGDAINIQGTLIAEGTQADSIRFKGFASPDYSYSTKGGYLYFDSGSLKSSLKNVVVDGWGDKNNTNYAISVNTSSVNISGSTIRNGGGTGIDISSSITPVIKSNIFSGNPKSIQVYPSSIDSIANNKNANIYLVNEQIQKNSTITQPGTGSYYVLQGGFNIPTGKTLTVQPGTEIRSASYSDVIDVYGTFLAAGTESSPIRFIGFANPDNPTYSTHGGTILFEDPSKNSVLKYAVMDNWGDKNNYAKAIYAGSSLLTITNNIITNSGLTAIEIPSGKTPSVTLNDFKDNTITAVRVDPGGLGGVLKNNNARILINPGSVDVNASWPNPGTNSYYALNGQINVKSNSVLTLEAGDIIDFSTANAYLFVDGTIRASGTQDLPIKFTRLDKTQGPYGGLVSLSSSSGNSTISNAVFDQMGSVLSNYPALNLETSNFSISNITISNSLGDGLVYRADKSPIITGSSFFNNRTGIMVASGKPVFNNCSIYGNTEFGINNSSSTVADTVDARNSYWGAPTGPFHATLNAAGKGNKVSDKVKFKPFNQQPNNGPIKDVGVTAIIGPVNSCGHTATDTVIVSLTNFGNTAQTSIPVSYRINSGTPVKETIAGITLDAGKTINYAFNTKANLQAKGSYTITAFTSLDGDTKNDNDTLKTTFQNLPDLAAVTGLIPANNTLNADVPLQISWAAVSGATGYDIYLWKDTDAVPTQPLITNTDQIVYSLPTYTLSFNTRYKWKIVARRENCTSTSSVNTFTTRPLPDLLVESISVPAKATSESSIQVSWKTKNQGSGGTGASQWNEVVYLCDQPDINASVQKYVIASPNNFSALNAGQSYQSNRFSFVLPQGLQGNYYVIVQTNPSQTLQEIAYDNNLKVSAAINVTLAPPPDLQVTSVVAGPLTAFSGDSVSVSYNIKNLGTGPTTVNYWTDVVFLSKSATVNTATDVQLLTIDHNQVLANNGQYAVTQKVRLPDHISGTYYINVVSDVYGQVFEYNQEGNNSLSSLALNVITRPSPNLVVKSITTTADSVTLKQPVNLQWVTANTGAVDATGSWTDQVYISTSNKFDENAVPCGSFSNVNTLASLNNYQASLAVNIPANIAEGTYYLYVKTDVYSQVDENADEGDNVSVASKPFKVVYPDLQAVSVTVPATGVSEQPVNIQWKVKNNSRVGVYNSDWQDGLYLSKDKVLDRSTDILLTGLPVNNFLTPGAAYQKSAIANLPVGVSGAYYVLLSTNNSGDIPEKSTTNNVVNAPITITLTPWPDLKVMTVATAAKDTAGTNLNFKYTVSNVGSGALKQKTWSDNIFISTTSSAANPDMIFLGSYTQNRALAAGEGYEQKVSLPIPANIAQGKYYIIVKADAGKTLFENNSIANNALAGAVINIVNLPPVDLSVVAGEPVTGNITAGKPAVVTWTVKNNSNIATVVPSWRDAVYLSNDAILDAGDRLLTSVAINKTVAAGSTYNQTATVQMPQDAPGTVYLLVVADMDNANLDNVRGNNTLPLSQGSGGGAITIFLPLSPDLTPVSFTATAKASASQPIDVSFAVKNIGQGGTGNQPWTDQVYLSTSANVQDGILVGSFPHTGSLTVSASYNVSGRVFLPEGISGNYVLLLKTDGGSSVYERNAENNNVASSNLLVTAQQPSDLLVRSITIPAGEQLAGDSVTVAWKLYNAGTNIAQGYLKDAVYLSRDTIPDAGDVLLGTFDGSIYLAPKATEQRSLTGPLTGLSTGTYYVLVRTDIQNTIVEQNENNNTAVSQGKLTIGVRQLQLNVLAATAINNTSPVVYRLEVPAALNGITLSIKLRGDSVNGAVNRLFIKKDTVPDANKYDYAAAESFKANQEAIIPALSAGTYYVTASGTSTNGNKQAITLLAKTIPFGIAAVDAPTGGNTGLVTVRITGAMFNPGMVVKLYGASSSTSYTATSVYYVDASKVFATFDLNRAPLGKYTVRLEKSTGDAVELSKGFEVISGTPGGSAGATQLFTCRIQNIGFDESIKLDVLHPESVRRNQKVKMTIAYANGGNVDIPVQSRVLLSLEGAPLNFTPDFDKQLKELFLEFKENDGPPGILRAGTSGFINVYTYAIAPMSFEITQ